MNSPIIIFNPAGLTDKQVKLIKQALDDAYRAGYETAKEFYQLKMNTPTYPNIGQTLTVPPQQWTVNNCSHGIDKGTYPTVGMTFADTEGTYAETKVTYASEYPNAGRSDCPHMYVNNKYRALGVCGLCGLSFDEWHG
jgi:type II secretory pathway pseudopilin PulG